MPLIPPELDAMGAMLLIVPMSIDMLVEVGIDMDISFMPVVIDMLILKIVLGLSSERILNSRGSVAGRCLVVGVQGRGGVTRRGRASAVKMYKR